MFFHIDEDAYNSLQRYLNAIKRSFTDSQGRDEIIADIEARVAELFSERLKSERQVIGMKEVEEVIEIMGQPEDYLVDDEIFEDNPRSSYRQNSTYRKLYRDYDNKFLGGVCAGFGQYFGIDALWIRVLFLILVFVTAGSPILVYIILWFIIPKANTTSEKLAMAGKPANITNIEKKIKEGFDDVQERINDVDFEQVGQKAKSGASSFFDSIGDVIVMILKIFAKLFGVIFIITAAALLIGIIFSAISVSFFDFNNVFHGNEWFYYQDLGMISSVPRWTFGLLILLILGIPAFALFILGIKILVKNSKSIGTPVKVAMVIAWIGAVIAASVIGSNAAMHRNVEASVNTRAELPIKENDTLKLKMVGNDFYDVRLRRDFNDYEKVYDQNDDIILYSTAIRLIVKQSESDNARIKINKEASGISYDSAKERARNIDYTYLFEDNTLKLNGYFLFDPNDKHNRQRITVTLYLPKGVILYADANTQSYHSNYPDKGDILDKGQEEQYLKVIDDDLICLDCPIEIEEEEEKKEKSDLDKAKEELEKVKEELEKVKEEAKSTTDTIQGNTGNN